MKLSLSQIEQLEKQNCTSDDWSLLSVPNNFNAKRYQNVTFRGEVSLGTCIGERETKGLGKVKTGIYNATIEDCCIGDEVFITNIVHTIKGFSIEDEVTIAHCFSITASFPSTCGIGTELVILDEMGSRKIKISSSLSSSLAYWLTFSPKESIIQEAYEKELEQELSLLKQRKNRIGKGSELLNCGRLQDIQVGSETYLEGVLRLTNGTVGGRVKIQGGTTADNFIIGNDSQLDNAILSFSFVGEGTHLSEGIVLEHSIVFSNCTLAKGEVTASLLGPYTVSMHRSTLLIGGVFSFFNAGSGTNQSNHHYRLGPIHFGVCEQGVKMASNAYISWPAHIGAFTTVAGRVTSHPQVEDFPFSLLLGEGQRTILKPAHNLSKGAVWRDCDKWKGRERRLETDRKWNDIHSISSLDTHLVHKVYKGYKLLKEYSTEDLAKRFNLDLSAKDHKRGLELYELYLKFFILLFEKEYGDCQKYQASIDTLYPQEEMFETIDLLGLTLSNFGLKRVEKELDQELSKKMPWYNINHLIEQEKERECKILKAFLVQKIKNEIPNLSSLEEIIPQIKAQILQDLDRDISLREKTDYYLPSEKPPSTSSFENYVADKYNGYKAIDLDSLSDL